MASSVISHCSAVSPFAVELALEQIAPGDFELLVLGVAGKLDDLHAVAHGAGNGIEHVGGGDEHDLREIEGDAEIVVAKGRVLLRVEHLEQRRRRIAVEAGAELVDLVEHHHRIARAGLADRLDDVARQGADIGAPMPPDLGFVVHAAEAQPNEFAAGRLGDALPERGLADARRADETQNRALAFGIELAHREIFEDAPLDLRQTVMVLIQDAARLRDVDVFGVELRPRQLDQPVQIGRGSSRIRAKLRACARGA